MAYLNFAQALMEAKRRAQLSGRPLSRQEAAGIAEGYAESASSRLARAKALSLQEQQMGTQASQFEKSQAQQAEQFGQSQAQQIAAREQAASQFGQSQAQQAEQYETSMIYNRAQALRDQKNREAEMEAQKQAGMIGTGTNLATTAATLYALKGMGAKAAAPAVTSGLDTYMAGKTAAAAGGEAAGATGAGMSGMAAAGYTAAILGAEELTSPVIEEQAGTSVKHATSIGAYAGAGAVAGSYVYPGIGTVIGGVVGGVVGGIREATGSVICTELHRQGIMSDKMFETDKAFGKKQDMETIAGYHIWAIPLANLMRKSKIVTWIIRPIAMAWAEDMAEGKNLFGKYLNKIGIPICQFIGSMKLRELKEAA